MEKNEEIPVLVADDKHPDAIDKCPECGSTNIIKDYDTRERICGNCGFVLGTEMAQGPEWRSYTQEERQQRERAGPPLKASQAADLTTKIQVDRDALGKRLKTEALFTYRKLSWLQRREARNESEKSLEFALFQIQKIADRLGIPSDSQFREDVATIYRKARKGGLLKGETKFVVAASFYYVFRRKNIARTLEEIEQATGVPKKYIIRYYRKMLRVFETQMPVSDLSIYVSKIAEKIGISGKTQGDAIEILTEAKNKKIPAGRKPEGIVAAALYIACRQNHEEIAIFGHVRRSVTQENLAEAAEVSSVTVRTLYKKLKKGLNLIVP